VACFSELGHELFLYVADSRAARRIRPSPPIPVFRAPVGDRYQSFPFSLLSVLSMTPNVDRPRSNDLFPLPLGHFVFDH